MLFLDKGPPVKKIALSLERIHLVFNLNPYLQGVRYWFHSGIKKS